MSPAVDAVDRALAERRSRLKQPMTHAKRRQLLAEIDRLLDRRNKLTKA